MSALARLCLKDGYSVYGYDKISSEITDQLVKKGIKIIFDNSVSALNEILLSAEVQVIYSAAIPNSHPQLEFYKKQGKFYYCSKQCYNFIS